MLVHPSAYGEDYSLLLTVLGGTAAIAGSDRDPEQFCRGAEGPARAGVRGARFSHRAGTGANFSGSATFDDLLRMTGRARRCRRCMPSYGPIARRCPPLRPSCARLPFPVVVDHMGGFDPAAGVDEEGFHTLLSLLEGGHVWVKLCVYRNTLKAPSIGAGQPFHQKMIEVNPSQLVWGSDWPHLNVKPRPDPAVLLRAFKDWTPDETLVRRILLENPARLYA